MDSILKNLESIFSIIESIAVVIGLISAVVAYRQWKERKSERQIQYLSDFSSSIMGNPDMATFIHMVEREDGVGFANGCFKPQENERIVDYALCHLSNYVVLKNSNLIDAKDFQFLDYILNHSLENAEIQAYLKFLQNVVQGNKAIHPYKQLVDYGKENGLLS